MTTFDRHPLGPAAAIRSLPWLWAALILVLLLLPAGGTAAPLPAQLDKLIHLGLFLVWTLLWRWLAPPPRPLWALLTVVTLALGTELAQHGWITGREGSVLDLLADLLGAAMGWQLGRLLHGRTKTVRN